LEQTLRLISNYTPYHIWQSLIYDLCLYPRCSMYGIFTCIWAICVVNVGKYSIHGASDMCSIYSLWFVFAFEVRRTQPDAIPVPQLGNHSSSRSLFSRLSMPQTLW
jgi:hypothetical protein